MNKCPLWLFVGASVRLPNENPSYAGPFKQGTFSSPQHVVTGIRFSPNYKSGIGVRIQTTGEARRYAGGGKWIDLGHCFPIRDHEGV